MVGRRQRHLALPPRPSIGDRLRARLLAGSALALTALAPLPAAAQLLTDSGAAQVSAGGNAPVITQAGRTTDILLGAPRTIIPWSSYKLTADQTAIYRFGERSWIVLNKVSGQAVIDGSIETLVGTQRGAGNVWFQAPGGVIFGPTARVNVGGLLATTGAFDPAVFLDQDSTRFDVTGAGGGAVEARGAALLNAAGGALALIAGSVSIDGDSSVTGANATVLLGAANDYTVRFTRTAGGDFDLVDFVVPTASAGTGSSTPLTVRGEVVGSNVYLAVVNRADVASAVIRAPGLIAAQSATSDRGDVVLTSGVGIVNRQPGLTRINTTTDTTFNLGVVVAQRDMLGGLAAPTALTAQQLAAGRDLGFAATSLDAGTLNAGRQLAVDAGRGITLRNGAAAGAAATFRTTGALTVGGGTGAINAIGRLQIDAGSVQAGQLSSGGSIVVNASGVGAGGRAVSLAGVTADDDVTVTTSAAAGHIVLGQASFTAVRGDSAPAGRNLILNAKGADADITFGTGPLSGATKVSLTAGRDVTASVTGLLTLTNGQAGRDFTIRAGDLDLAGPLSAARVRIESMGGNVTVGGGGAGAPREGLAAPGEFSSAGAEGLRLTDAEFQQITVTDRLSVYAGATGGAARGTLTVMDVHVATTRVPKLLLAAGPDNDVALMGAVAPNASGGVISIGEDTPDNGWQPGRILISGSIGAALGPTATGFSDVRSLSETHLSATREIIMGSPRFINLVSGVPSDQIDLANDKPAGVAATPEEQGKVWISTGILTMSASARILQQNTGSRAKPTGVLIDDSAPGARPAGTPKVMVTTGGTVDVFGTVRTSTGTVTGGLGAGLGGVAVTGTGGDTAPPPVVRFNGLDVVAGDKTGGLLTLVDSRVQVTAQGTNANQTPPGEEAVNGLPPEPPVLSSPNPDPEAIDLDAVPVGTGSYELWKRKVKRRF